MESNKQHIFKESVSVSKRNTHACNHKLKLHRVERAKMFKWSSFE